MGHPGKGKKVGKVITLMLFYASPDSREQRMARPHHRRCHAGVSRGTVPGWKRRAPARARFRHVQHVHVHRGPHQQGAPTKE